VNNNGCCKTVTAGFFGMIVGFELSRQVTLSMKDGRQSDKDISEYFPDRVSDHDLLREGREVWEAAPGSLRSAAIFGSSAGRSSVMTLQTME
jgi:hypothetical protein